MTITISATGNYNPANGTGADDRAAFQAAFDAAQDGDTIHLPAPQAGLGYRLGGPVVINKRVTVNLNHAEIYVTGIGAFSLLEGAGKCTINNPKITGNRPGSPQTGFTIYSQYVHIQNGYLSDLNIGIDVTGGVWQTLKDMTMRNMVKGAVQLGNVVGTRVQNLKYDTDAGFPQPEFGLRIFGEGCVISDCDIIHAGICLLLETEPTRDNTWNFFNSCSFDTSPFGIVIRNNTSRKLAGQMFNNCWSASMGNAAVWIQGNQAIDGVTFDGCHFLNNENHAIINEGNTNNVVITGCQFGGNGVSAPNARFNIYSDSIGSKLIRSCTFGKYGQTVGVVQSDLLRTARDGACVFSENWSDTSPSAGPVNGAGASPLRYGINYGYASPSR
ncbi:right-handed parallel beta-helix repeat-containing protein [Pseudomonas sp. DSP3-2-2]|uniref:right-handed parallel beta-helix repeat-containing protein n=1 Tax=unclassified Pseudomonas TaxID=196821 RepID=UPI003CEFA3EB